MSSTEWNVTQGKLRECLQEKFQQAVMWNVYMPYQDAS